MWNVPIPNNGLPSAETSIVLNLGQMPFDAFKVEVFVLDGGKAAGVRALQSQSPSPLHVRSISPIAEGITSCLSGAKQPGHPKTQLVMQT